ncbi:putative bifunctional diguanylate cyclase/phosphodiesterase [Catenuloplanes atrovinosus]|uniref:Diguanylate cyclase (GGDEF)-like protein n=1 Tax=Catenuloplanes atrovinosus TaxID=137266 RepID=A0AAE3YK60_9ACTN|nr:EAL domain-containing protein [Catenuloplanes atrovinosus]MDR7273894.1 diguanylate cyclase (GGDEF)-like protein [Catenuloplanes atrovinosus]
MTSADSRGGVRFAVAAAAVAALFQTLLLIWPASGAAPMGQAVLCAALGWAVVVYLRAARGRRHGRFWMWAIAAAGLVLWLASNVMMLAAEATGRHLVPHAVVALPTLVMFACAFTALLMLPTAPEGWAGKLRMTLDGVQISTALLMPGWILAVEPALHGDTFQWVSISYTIGSLAVLAVALLLLSGAQGQPALGMLSGAVSLAAIYNLIATYLTINTSLAPDRYLDGLMLLVILLVAGTPRMPLGTGTDTAWTPRPVVGGWLMPYLPAVGSLTIGLAHVLAARHFDLVVVGLAALMIVAILTRQGLSLWMTARLTAELTEQRQRLAHQAAHDPLTGLANRSVFAERLAAALAPGGDGVPALLMVDLDGFKAVNDTLGHGAGDTLLIEVSRRLAALTRGGDTVARLGGDEFAVLLADADADTAAGLAERLLAELTRPVRVDNGDASVGASIGITLSGTDYLDDPGRMLRDADLALYAAKADGKGRHRFADEALIAESLHRLELDGELRNALLRDELRIHYQPVVDLGTGRLTGAEALLRWQHPQRGLLPPAMFLPAAEANGLLPEIDRWVLHQAARQGREWQGDAGFSVSVNVTAGHVLSGRLVQDVREALHGSGLPAERLVLELTETSLLYDLAGAAVTLTELADMGVRVALDDFGTGYASLSYLQNLPIHAIKIDRSFVQRLGDDSTSSAVTQALVNLAETLGISQIAEGVETPDQLDRLRGLQCAFGQGFFFSNPLPPEELSKVLADERAAATPS